MVKVKDINLFCINSASLSSLMVLSNIKMVITSESLSSALTSQISVKDQFEICKSKGPLDKSSRNVHSYLKLNGSALNSPSFGFTSIQIYFISCYTIWIHGTMIHQVTNTRHLWVFLHFCTHQSPSIHHQTLLTSSTIWVGLESFVCFRFYYMAPSGLHRLISRLLYYLPNFFPFPQFYLLFIAAGVVF